MIIKKAIVVRAVQWVLAVACSGFAGAEEFTIQMGDTVTRDNPAAGAGFIESSTATDLYQFHATAGQAVYLEEISVSTNFQGWLGWQLRAPSGLSLMQSYFQGSDEGRRNLPETGTYTLRVSVLSNQPEYTGEYSFRLRAIPPDSTFAIQVGDEISPGAPAAGAGVIEVPGAQDVYTFEGTTNQHIWFEELAADDAFGRWLEWELKSPSGQTVFRSYLDENHLGRKTLPETGAYQLRVFAATTTTNHVGTYAFRLRPIPPDQSFAIQLGDTVTNGLPAAGAGNLEVAGAQDFYEFTGAAGQSVFFEMVNVASTFAGWLYWELKSPGGATVFSSAVSSGAGRRTLPETGTYRLRLWAAANNPNYTGTYAFRLTLNDTDGQYVIPLGQTVAPGIPAAGAGVIEQASGRDTFTFTGIGGQEIVLEEISAAATFQGYLRYELRAPNSNTISTAYFQPGRRQRHILPTNGLYTLRVFVSVSNPQYIGEYSFRILTEVFAHPDKLAVEPGTTLAIPSATLLCNDTHQPMDTLTVELPAATTAPGGSVTLAGNTVVYSPPAEFTGQDSFTYRARGTFGGESLATVTVWVVSGAAGQANVVSYYRNGENTVALCLLGAPGETYEVERTADFETWSTAGSLTADSSGAMHYEYRTDTAEKRFFRFVRP